MRNNSLRVRMIAAFTVAGLLLGTIFGGLVKAFLHDIEDEVTENQQRLEAEAFAKRYAEDPSVEPLDSFLSQGYVGRGNIPADLAAMIGSVSPGWHELVDDYHLYVQLLPGTDERLYLFQSTRGVEPLEGFTLTRILILGVLLVTLVAAWFGAAIAKRILAPVTNLARQVKDVDPSSLPISIQGQFRHDEVGALADAFRRAMDRINDFIQREQHFTRDASHELRSPVTVIKGAVAIIRRKDNDVIDQPLRRIERATKDMENIIETFLYLGREGSMEHSGEPTHVVPVVENLLAQNAYLLEDKSVEANLIIEQPCVVAAPEPVVHIALGNLLRNACQYTDQGHITVTIGANVVTIRDTGRGMDPALLAAARRRHIRGQSAAGFGLGLSIVADFCHRHGWRLNLESEPNQGIQATLMFSTYEP